MARLQAACAAAAISFAGASAAQDIDRPRLPATKIDHADAPKIDGDLNDENAAHPLTDAQLKANADLVRYLAGKYPNLDYMIAHSEYRDLEDHRHPAHSLFREDKPLYRTEKSDPGRRFMDGLRKQLGN